MKVMSDRKIYLYDVPIKGRYFSRSFYLLIMIIKFLRVNKQVRIEFDLGDSIDVRFVTFTSGQS